MLTKAEIEEVAEETMNYALERIDFDSISSYAIEEDWSEEDISNVLQAVWRAKVTYTFE